MDRLLRVEREVEALEAYVGEARRHLEDRIARLTLLSREEAARILGASVAQLDRWAASGQLARVQLDRRPRYRLGDIESFVEARAR